MNIIANGKNIPTYEFSELLIQGEKLADTIVFEVDRFYNGYDLSDHTFVINGLTSEGYEAMQALEKEVGAERIKLIWQVSGEFTEDAGELRLCMTASPEYGEIDHIIRYAMQPVNVRPFPAGRERPEQEE